MMRMKTLVKVKCDLKNPRPRVAMSYVALSRINMCIYMCSYIHINVQFPTAVSTRTHFYDVKGILSNSF
jgi:hypothetical protein